jgi:2Fe-2S ferredoxin
MTLVIVLPGEFRFEAGAGQTLMSAAGSHGYYWPTTCGGLGTCTTCLTEVVEGGNGLREMGRGEFRTLSLERGEGVRDGRLRLACQAVIDAGVDTITVRKQGVTAGVA